MALTRFKRTLKLARLNVRELTHTLHLPPAQSEIYDGPHPEWLRDVLEQLPHLQTLVVSQILFFDHSSLCALRLSSKTRQLAIADTVPTFALRLLIATQCRNTTSTSLAEALIHLPNLVFLDLSNTTAARDKHVLSNLRYMSNLQVLKLRQINLKDEDVQILADAVHARVRSLDVRGNLLTDKSATTLLNCFILVDVDDGLTGSELPILTYAGLEDWPPGISRPDPAILDDFRCDALDEHFIKQLAKPTVKRLPSEDLPRSGITHLYISDNKLSINGLAKLLKSNRLFVLDAGAVNTASESSQSFSSSSLRDTETSVSVPGVEKLVPTFEKHCAQSLTSLRIHHAVVTRKTFKDHSSIGTPPLTYELSADDTRYELNAVEPVFELTIEEPEPRYELPGDSTYVVVSPATGNKPSDLQETPPLPHGGGAFAPEVVKEADFDGDAASILTPTGLGSMAQAVNGITGTNYPLSPTEEPDMLGMESKHDLSISLIQSRRRELHSRQHKMPHALSPGMLPKLRTLTLTDIPCNDHDHRTVDALIQFLRDCASEAELAELEANLLKPSRENIGYHRSEQINNGARSIFALSRIVLEMAPSAASSKLASNPSHTSQTSNFGWRTKSSTEDADSEALWTAQENDFSFFGDEEECGLPATEPWRHHPLSTVSEKIIIPTDDAASDTSPTSQSKKAELGADVIQELAHFRKQRKVAYEEAVNRGETMVDGYWPGDVEIVRWHARNSHMTDY